jgi:hypothetical protein
MAAALPEHSTSNRVRKPRLQGDDVEQATSEAPAEGEAAPDGLTENELYGGKRL